MLELLLWGALCMIVLVPARKIILISDSKPDWPEDRNNFVDEAIDGWDEDVDAHRVCNRVDVCWHDVLDGVTKLEFWRVEWLDNLQFCSIVKSIFWICIQWLSHKAVILRSGMIGLFAVLQHCKISFLFSIWYKIVHLYSTLKCHQFQSYCSSPHTQEPWKTLKLWLLHLEANLPQIFEHWTYKCSWDVMTVKTLFVLLLCWSNGQHTHLLLWRLNLESLSSQLKVLEKNENKQNRGQVVPLIKELQRKKIWGWGLRGLRGWPSAWRWPRARDSVSRFCLPQHQQEVRRLPE